MKFPKDPKKIKAQIQRYEQALKQERKTFGAIDDSGGKRYLLGPLYLLMGDVAGAVKSFAWFAKTFPDDMGEPFQYLCWSLALYRSGKLEEAAQKLQQTMLKNLYLLPHLLGIPQAPLDIWHSSNWEQASYLQEAPPEYLALWDEEARRWAQAQYESPALTQLRNRYIAIYQQLKTEPVGPKRQQLVQEVFILRS